QRPAHHTPPDTGITEPTASRSWPCVSVTAMSGARHGAQTAVEVGEPQTDAPPADAIRQGGRRRLPSWSPARWRLVAKVLGIVSALCALAIPFMPIIQDTARIVWPAPNSTQAINTPLVGYWALEIDATVPCA